VRILGGLDPFIKLQLKGYGCRLEVVEHPWGKRPKTYTLFSTF